MNEVQRFRISDHGIEIGYGVHPDPFDGVPFGETVDMVLASDYAALAVRLAAMEADWRRLRDCGNIEMGDGDLAWELAEKWVGKAPPEPEPPESTYSGPWTLTTTITYSDGKP